MSFNFIETDEQFNELYGKLIDSKEQVVYADTETTGLDCFNNEILLFQLRMGKENHIVDVRGLGYTALKKLVEMLNAINVTVVWHNAKFDLKFIKAKTNILLEKVYDTMACEVILNAGKGKQYYSLSELSEYYAGIFMDKNDRLAFVDYPEDKPFTEKLLNYSALDVLVLEPIYEEQIKLIEANKATKVIELEMELIPVVSLMEFNGINIDTERWIELQDIAEREYKELNEEFVGGIADRVLSLGYENGLVMADTLHIPARTKKLRNLLETITDTGNLRGWFIENFNSGSPIQMKTVLNLMGIDVPNTNAKTLLDFADEYEIVSQLLSLRELGKKVSSYGGKFLENINTKTGKIHTEYQTSGTRTGRFSSRNPNMQQIPRKGGYRECFIPSDGYIFISLDYSQQEYRLAGALSNEDAIINAYKSGSDMHTATARIVYNKPDGEITSEERSLGKTLNFAILYGSTEFGLRHNLKISLDRALEIISTFWRGYPKLKAFNDYAGEKILELGYSVTPIGRRRYNSPQPVFGDGNAVVRWREAVLREGKNFIIQGGGADILKIAMVNIHKKNPFGDDLRILLQIHDELLVEVKKEIQDVGFQFIKDEMEAAEQPFLGEIPAVVEGKLKERWSK